LPTTAGNTILYEQASFKNEELRLSRNEWQKQSMSISWIVINQSAVCPGKEEHMEKSEAFMNYRVKTETHLIILQQKELLLQ